MLLAQVRQVPGLLELDNKTSHQKCRLFKFGTSHTRGFIMEKRVDEIAEALMQAAEAEGYTSEDLAYGVAILAAGLIIVAEVENGFSFDEATTEVMS